MGIDHLRILYTEIVELNWFCWVFCEQINKFPSLSPCKEVIFPLIGILPLILDKSDKAYTKTPT